MPTVFPSALPSYPPSAYFGSRTVTGFAANLAMPQYSKLLPELAPDRAVLLQMLNMVDSEPARADRFDYFCELWSGKTGDCLVYNDSALTTLNTAGLASGALVYAKTSAATAGFFRQGSGVVFNRKGNLSGLVHGYVSGAVVTAGASSYLPVTLVEASGANGFNPGGAVAWTTISRIGSANEEFSSRPERLSKDPTPYYNFLQTFRTGIGISRRAAKTELRTNETASQQEFRRAYGDHMEDIETQFWLGQRFEGSKNGSRLTLMGGLFNMVSLYGTEATNFRNFYTNTGAYAGKTWSQSGKSFLEEVHEEIFQFQNKDVVCVCGSGYIRGIMEVIENSAVTQIVPGTVEFGGNISRWLTPYGHSITFKLSPLFSQQESLRYTGVYFSPDQLTKVVFEDTFLESESPDKAVATRSRALDRGQSALAELGLDGSIDGLITDVSLKVDWPQKIRIVTGGMNNVSAT